jgi:hypothetical protein|tara:strand:- start:36 stop:329 length:294 start_codon:yes stop_codon:yes gene_type:complete
MEIIMDKTLIPLLGHGNDLCHGHFSEDGATYIIKALNEAGYEGEYVQTNNETGWINYPNYKEADDIVSGYVCADTMEEYCRDGWIYLKNTSTEEDQS